MTQERLKELFEYKDGHLIWKVPITCNRMVGEVAGYQMDKRYWVINIDKKIYRAHRLIYLWHHGYCPKFLDHIDKNKINNRIDNLRPATKSQNMSNRGKQKNNTSGYKGVHWVKSEKIYTASVQKDGRTIHLGRFRDPELAHAAYVKAATVHHKEFAHG